MRLAFLALIAATLGGAAAAQDVDPFAIGVAEELSINHSPCAYEHDPAVEKVLQVVGFKVKPVKPPKNSPVTYVELRNNSSKMITAFVLTDSVGGRVWVEGSFARGIDLVWELALVRYSKKPAPSNTILPPGGIYEFEVGPIERRHVEVYPCTVVFDDRTGVGPPGEVSSLLQMRATSAESMGAVVAELESARHADDPKIWLMLRAKQLASQGVVVAQPNTSPVRTRSRGTGPSRHLEWLAAELAGGRNNPRDQKLLADYISVYSAQRDALLAQSTPN
jgi:hypothetical protein